MSQQDIIKYYEDCDIDYRTIWGTDVNYGLHYGFYDRDHRNHHQAVLNQNRVLADKAGIKPGDRVLDCGCGIGGSCLWLAQNRGAECVGLNITAAQLKQARRLVKEKNLEDKVTFYERDFCYTEFPDNSFDVVWGMEAMSYAQDKHQLVKEVFRVLKPGGRIATSDGWMNDISPNKSLDKEVCEWLDTWAVPHLAGISEFEGYLQQEGFKNIQFTDAYDMVMPSAARMFRYAALAYPAGKLMSLLRLRNDVQWGNIRGAFLQYKTLKNRAWVHGHFIAQKPRA